MLFYHTLMCPENADGMANRVDLDQTVPEVLQESSLI